MSKNKGVFKLFTGLIIYTAACFLELIFCYLFKHLQDTKQGELFLLLALLLILYICFHVILSVKSLIYNILKTIAEFSEHSSKRFLWLVLAVISPILYIILFMITVFVFVDVTGGV